MRRIVWTILVLAIIAPTIHASCPCVGIEMGIYSGMFAWGAACSSGLGNDDSTDIASGNRLQNTIGDILDYSSHLKGYCELVLKEVSSAKDWHREKWIKCVVEPLVAGIMAAVPICLRAGPWWPVGVVVGIIVAFERVMKDCF
ncbi:MAG: hypothetical protein JSU69_10195 [Candidatus Zixiibacteriota bacterium]|nr:MAG: hypothetical protein JSU69_10195 [candidate division Zixibacteria bacterium]